MGLPEWNEAAYAGETGVDHLGMRVAGEMAYSQLLDFTTTVSWRPRYFSFWCSALRRAFAEAGGHPDQPESRIDLTRWRSVLRRQDYAIATATLLVDGTAVRIAGSDRIRADMASGPMDDARRIVFSGEHLGAASGSLSIYLGPMLQVGLVQSDGVVHTPCGAGCDLADAFDASLAAARLPDILSAEDATLGDLRTLGERCGLTQLSRGDSTGETAHERDVLRRAIVPRLTTADERLRRRALSIAMILNAASRCRTTLGLDEFREFVQLDGQSPAFERMPELPEHFEPVRAAWRAYQGHAYATFALEALLAAVLSLVNDSADLYGDGVPPGTLESLILQRFEEGASATDPLQLGTGWPAQRLDLAIDALSKKLSTSAPTLAPEPEIYRLVSRDVRGAQVLHYPRYLANCVAMVLLCMARMRRLEIASPGAWLGARSSWRLPPSVLVAALEKSMSSGVDIAGFVSEMLRELVLQQHRSNALRKLEANPSIYTARFLTEEGRIVLVGTHRPGTSNPRLENAVMFLRDLGYLTTDNSMRLSPAGASLLAELSQEVT